MTRGSNLLKRAHVMAPVDSNDVAARSSDALHRLGDQASVLAQSVAEQAATAAVSGAERAREVRSTLGEAAKERGPQVSQVSQKVSEEVVPALRDVAVQAASLALELWQAARERAHEASESARHELAPQATGIIGSAERRAGEATHVVAHKAEEAVSRTRDASRHAAQATVDSGKDTGAMFFWAGAATGVILFALMSKERRDQLLKLAESSIGQVREIIHDFQGYDEEFTPSA